MEEPWLLLLHLYATAEPFGLSYVEISRQPRVAHGHRRFCRLWSVPAHARKICVLFGNVYSSVSSRARRKQAQLSPHPVRRARG